MGKKRAFRSHSSRENNIENKFIDSRCNTLSANKSKNHDVDYSKPCNMQKSSSKQMFNICNTVIEEKEHVNPLFYNSFTNGAFKKQLKLENLNDTSLSKSCSFDKDS